MAEKKRIGVHVGTAGGTWTAVERAVAAGANTFQIFSSSPRMWRAAPVKAADAKKMHELRAKLDVGPVAIHASYLINLCSQTETVRENSITAFRGEVERALALGAEYLVLHPGSWKGLTREEGLRLAAQSIERAIDGVAWQGKDFRILIENTAGAEFSLGGQAGAGGGAGGVSEGLRSGGGVPGYVPRACSRIRHCVYGWIHRDDEAGGIDSGVRCGEGVALQRCEGGDGVEAGPA